MQPDRLEPSRHDEWLNHDTATNQSQAGSSTCQELASPQPSDTLHASTVPFQSSCQGRSSNPHALMEQDPQAPDNDKVMYLIEATRAWHPGWCACCYEVACQMTITCKFVLSGCYLSPAACRLNDKRTCISLLVVNSLLSLLRVHKGCSSQHHHKEGVVVHAASKTHNSNVYHRSSM